MKKVEYIVGAFLAEYDIVSHELPEQTIDKPKTKRSCYQSKTTETKLKRKTENTTKKIKPQTNEIEE